MKRIALSLLAVLALGAPAKAIVGGPWDNNLFYSPTINGTFQGTATAKNLSAVMMFSVGDGLMDKGEGAVFFPNAGRMVTFYKGMILYSAVEAVPDASTRKIAAAITPWDLSHVISAYDLSGFMEAKFDNIYPAITYKGKAELFSPVFDPSVDPDSKANEYGIIRARVRGIKTSTKTIGLNWNLI